VVVVTMVLLPVLLPEFCWREAAAAAAASFKGEC
jgi:hypothetical protein